MLGFTVLLFVILTVVGLINFVGGGEVEGGPQDPSNTKIAKIKFPTELYPPPHHEHYGPPCYNCNHGHHDHPPQSYHNNEGYPSSNFEHTHGRLPHEHSFPPGFKHSPEFHRDNFGERDGRNFVRFDDETEKEKPEVVGYHNESVKGIPLEYLEKFDEIDVNDVLSNYVDGYEENDKRPKFENRFGDDGQERNAGVIPATAACIPEKISVPLATSDDDTVVYIPKCTRIERCGGCCTHQLLACQPTEIETISVQVVKAQYTGAKKLKYIAKEIIPLERHLKCKCSCRVRAEHCLRNQQYRANLCGCVCTNVDEEKKCYRDVEKKEWDDQTCSCKCRNVVECSTGSVYDHNECRCKTSPKRRFAKYERRGYVIEEFYVTPLQPE